VDALTANPQLHLVAVVPRFRPGGRPGRASHSGRTPPRNRRVPARRTGRVHVFDVENDEGTPVYVHSKVCVLDDVWACVGSDNFQ